LPLTSSVEFVPATVAITVDAVEAKEADVTDPVTKLVAQLAVPNKDPVIPELTVKDPVIVELPEVT
jgi:hypothetical protein